MRTIQEAEDLLRQYQDAIQGADGDQYVVTADSMTLNKNASTGRYVITKANTPTVFDKSMANAKFKKFSKRNEMIHFEVVPYKDWLTKEISKLRTMISKITPEEEEEEEETPKEIRKLSIHRVESLDCPLHNNNCKTCIYCKDYDKDTIFCSHE